MNTKACKFLERKGFTWEVSETEAKLKVNLVDPDGKKKDTYFWHAFKWNDRDISIQQIKNNIAMSYVMKELEDDKHHF